VWYTEAAGWMSAGYQCGKQHWHRATMESNESTNNGCDMGEASGERVAEEATPCV